MRSCSHGPEGRWETPPGNETWVVYEEASPTGEEQLHILRKPFPERRQVQRPWDMKRGEAKYLSKAPGQRQGWAGGTKGRGTSTLGPHRAPLHACTSPRPQGQVTNGKRNLQGLGFPCWVGGPRVASQRRGSGRCCGVREHRGRFQAAPHLTPPLSLKTPLNKILVYPYFETGETEVESGVAGEETKSTRLAAPSAQGESQGPETISAQLSHCPLTHS